MPWISKNSYLTEEEMQNNADLVISYFRDLAYDDSSIAALLGNLQRESTINPGLYEVGGSGYGLIQWTPQSSLITHASNLGSSNWEDGDIQCAVVNSEITGNPSNNNEWYTTEGFISPYYNSGATSDMIGVTGQEWAGNSGNHDVKWLTIMFMVGRLRPSYDPDVNYISGRIEWAEKWFEYMGGISPSHKKPIPGWNVDTIIQWGAIAETIRRRRMKL